MKNASNNLAQQFIDAYHNGAFPFLHAVHMEPVEIGEGTGSLKIVLNGRPAANLSLATTSTTCSTDSMRSTDEERFRRERTDALSTLDFGVGRHWLCQCMSHDLISRKALAKPVAP